MSNRLFVKNTKQLSRTPERAVALALLEAGLTAIATKEVIDRAITIERDHIVCTGCDNKKIMIAHESYKRLFVVAIGKCSIDASLSLERIFGKNIHKGIAVDVRDEPAGLHTIALRVGTHPYPSTQNIEYSKEIISLLEETNEDDLVLFIISGGASTLLCHPENHTCEDERVVVEELFKAGATIQELNTVRKHLSLVRGGNLAKAAYPARSLSLIFSDVVGDELSCIASGPTLRDTTTKEDAARIFEKYNLQEACNVAYVNLVDTPKEEKYFEKAEHLLVVSNTVLLRAMAARAHELGYTAEICTHCLYGEARDVGKAIAERLHSTKPKHILLFGGESTVTINGTGSGGRNQELALAALMHIRDGETILACATDGKDNSPVAGAIADTLAKDTAVHAGVSIAAMLEDNNSYTAYKQIGDYVDTGYTGSNTADVVIAIKSHYGI